jgi:hypothetical protein
MQPATVSVDAHLLSNAASETGDRTIQVLLHNTASVPALEAKLVLEQADGKQLLPAYYSDNYVSLLPGEERTITIDLPADEVKGSLHCKLRGWNVVPSIGKVAAASGN